MHKCGNSKTKIGKKINYSFQTRGMFLFCFVFLLILIVTVIYPVGALGAINGIIAIVV